MAIKQYQVNRICDNLTAAGKKPTLAAVREEAGTGSFSTIGPMIKVWQDMQQNEDNDAQKQLDNLRQQVEMLGHMIRYEQEQAKKARDAMEAQRDAMLPLLEAYVKDGRPTARPKSSPEQAVRAWERAAEALGWK